MSRFIPQPPPSKARKIKQYTLIVSVFASQHQAGAALNSNTFGPFETIEECKEAGEEAKSNFIGYHGILYYTCVPTYKKVYV